MAVYENERDNQNKAFIRFGINGIDLVPGEISDLLRINPSKSWNTGELYQSRFKKKDGSTGIQQRKRPWAIWELSSKEQVLSDDIEKHAEYILNIVEPKKNSISSLLNEKKTCRVIVSIWWEPEGGQGGYSLASKTVIRLAALCDEIYFYFC